MKNISILGSTGSIGVSTLDVISANPSKFKVVALSAGRNLVLLKDQIDRFRPSVVSVVDRDNAEKLVEMLGSSRETKVLWGADGYREAASLKSADMVVSAIVGSAGLLPTIDAIDAGKDIALANKETMVMAGNLVLEKARSSGSKILPVDSEHGAIFQCLNGHSKGDVRKIILTASGGPFLNLTAEQLACVKLEDALEHPNWKMGKKITVDSASMMNKGLEVIEAKWLFDIDIEKIEVCVHPQSIVHSMVEYVDGSIIAQLGVPDMKMPISYALSYPERVCRAVEALDLCNVGRLEFTAPDFDRFPNLGLAYMAAKKGGSMPVVLNASNEIAVDAFIDGKIGFTDISKIVGETLKAHCPGEPSSVEAILEADTWGRRKAEEIIKRMISKP